MTFIISDKEREQTLKNLFRKGPDGPLDVFPSKEKRKFIVAEHLANRFEIGKAYSEREVNEILKRAYPDYATIRRFFIDYGLMERSYDGRTYMKTERK
ncbi:hypothetical protein C772_02021 [Bhargavaea cecembensis DSE10]|uniref:DUF2087 domain-containing protein n=1 Tax=Bhargavaea cecembensis DSE10 TaxID=1235279 RepID=M7NFR5_9BACL|nr:DUF2087 domain-containing protein [Bhargavaea cecembensis]EMR06041.1 hypothetical protein C772_02021 [Bhargavaea cecembensis DSE10]